MKRYLRQCFLLLAALLVGRLTAVADTISFFNTGLAANGSLLAAGASDSHYRLIYNPDGVTETATATTPNAAWTANSSSAGWISPGASGSANSTAGYYVYETTIDLTGYNAATAVLTGSFAADDVVSVYLNHSSLTTYASASGYSGLSSFTINSGFVSGLNYVDFAVYNTSGPTGLLVANTSAHATAIAQTPEPAALLLVATGALAIGFKARRKRLPGLAAGLATA